MQQVTNLQDIAFPFEFALYRNIIFHVYDELSCVSSDVAFDYIEKALSKYKNPKYKGGPFFLCLFSLVFVHYLLQFLQLYLMLESKMVIGE